METTNISFLLYSEFIRLGNRLKICKCWLLLRIYHILHLTLLLFLTEIVCFFDILKLNAYILSVFDSPLNSKGGWWYNGEGENWVKLGEWSKGSCWKANLNGSNDPNSVRLSKSSLT